MTHADRIREAERAVVEAAVAQATCLEFHSTMECIRKNLNPAVDALLALRAATCPKCGGMGAVFGDDPRMSFAPPCPENCDAGKRREP